MKFSHQCDSLDHVLDMAADGADCGQLLSVTPPLVHTELRETTQPPTLSTEQASGHKSIFQDCIAKDIVMVYKTSYNSTFFFTPALVAYSTLVSFFFLKLQFLYASFLCRNSALSHFEIYKVPLFKS